jgi:cytochrome c-type biogenesis protein CcmE
MRSKKVQIFVAFTTVSLILVWLVFSGFDSETMQYYVKISEVKAGTSQNFDKGLRVKGKLVDGSLVANETSLDKSFRIVEDGQELEVHYTGLLPDTFKDGAEVLVEGKYTAEGYFVAKTVMAKCPSKYESEDGYNVEGYGTDNPSPTNGTN